MNTREKLSWTLLGVASFLGIAAVSTDTSFFKNASLSGWLSLSGETNRLTIASDALLLDGSAIGGETVWTNSAGTLRPISTPTTFQVTATNYVFNTDGGVVMTFDYDDDFFPRFPLGFSTRDPDGEDNGFFVDVSGNVGDALATGWSIDADSGAATFAADKLTIEASGLMGMAATITAAATTGGQTINKAAGAINIAAGQQSAIVTNSLVTATSVVIATVATDDSAASAAKAIPTTGSFTLKLNSAANAETRVNWIVIKPL
jgi:hypothetical protein